MKRKLEHGDSDGLSLTDKDINAEKSKRKRECMEAPTRGEFIDELIKKKFAEPKKKPHIFREVPKSLEQVRLFIPEIERENSSLKNKTNIKDLQIDNVSEDEKYFISFELGLGLLELKCSEDLTGSSLGVPEIHTNLPEPQKEEFFIPGSLRMSSSAEKITSDISPRAKLK